MGLARSWANDKKIIWDLPEAGQTLKKDFETCPKLGKRQKNNLRLAQGWANDKKIF
ncbi:hypothetical protein [Segatella oulorum]|uniref:hypothetical protein n=1 Tax=Segatella oulorum TaxID=28136 RepID=UPI0012DEB176|nr:hypothetical protein [Segatella oulorum]